jgi:hypothetical protein
LRKHNEKSVRLCEVKSVRGIKYEIVRGKNPQGFSTGNQHPNLWGGNERS